MGETIRDFLYRVGRWNEGTSDADEKLLQDLGDLLQKHGMESLKDLQAFLENVD